jgi:hypothetical protein
MLQHLQPETDTLPPPRKATGFSWGLILALAAALVVGLLAREVAYDCTWPVRHQVDQRNAFYWGNRIAQTANPAGGPAGPVAFWHAYVGEYQDTITHPAPKQHALDYVPLRLLMAGAWVQYLKIAFGPVQEWRPEFSRSFTTFSLLMELIAAGVMFCLVRRWMQRCDSRWKTRPSLAGAIAAICFWLNPAAIIDSHVWPHGETWIFPFYLGACLASLESRFLLAGLLIGIGAMLKGQLLLAAPALVLWPLFDRRWLEASRVTLGILLGILMVVWPWVIGGNVLLCLHLGLGGVGYTSDTLRHGGALNLAALLQKYGHMTLHQPLLALNIAGHPLSLELKASLILGYFAVLACTAWGMARQARARDVRLLVSLATPWAVMFFIMPQMDVRYLVWCACLTAPALLVNRRGLAAHLLLTLAAATGMLEMLLTTVPGTWTSLFHLLLRTNTPNFLLIGTAVFLLVTNALAIPRARHEKSFPRHLQDLPSRPLYSRAA